MFMGCVRILDSNVVNQIAAGEVVERPASVVKELVENSIDAGATEITVIVHNGGHSSIEIIDNGCGMSKEDALVAIERFGTSKIVNADDLWSIGTHGFRGEALPSIASVSRFQLITRQTGAKDGVSIDIEGGVLGNVGKVSCEFGTRISVRQLFYNVPARRRFLRSERTESGLIRAVMQDVAVAYPQLRIVLVMDGSEVLKLAPSDSFFNRARDLKFGGADPLLVNYSMSYPDGEVNIIGVMSQPVDAVTSSGRVRVLVNRRSVRDALALRAIRDGYGSLLASGRYPVGVVHLTVPPADVDVNVHPQKAEVRFRVPQVMYSAISRGVASALDAKKHLAHGGHYEMANSEDAHGAKHDIMPDAMHAEPQQQQAQFWQQQAYAGNVYQERKREPVTFFGKSDFFQPNLPQSNFDKTASFKTEFFCASDCNVDTDISNEVKKNENNILFGENADRVEARCDELNLASLRFVGQLLGCYLVLDDAENVVFVDMHAAHERVTYYRIQEQASKREIVSQQLLIPEIIPIPFDKKELLEDMNEDLEKLGFALKISEQAVEIMAVPAILEAGSVASLINDLCAISDAYEWQAQVDSRFDKIMASLACHSSVRSGRILEREEVYALLKALQTVPRSGYCPHGRPVYKIWRRTMFERMFERQ